MKTATGLLWAALLMAAMAGCGTSGESSQNEGPSTSTSKGGTEGKALKVGIVFDSGGRGDKSFNDSAWAGVEEAKKELGIEESSVESKAEKDYETNLSTLADKGYDLVVAVGLNQGKALQKVAPMYPKINFAIVDGDVQAPNVRCLKFKEEEGSFLVGYLAGLMSKTGKIGFVGGMELDLIKKFQYGYAAGALTANPKIEVLPAKFTGSWDNVDQAKAAATILFQQGADVVYHAAGRAGLGVIRAAKDAGKYAIGVDSDQDYLEPGTVLTSMVKRVNVAVFNTIKDLKEGKFAAGEQIYDLKADGVGISELSYTKDKIGPDNTRKLEEVKAKIISGEIKVPATKAEFDAFSPS